MLRQFCRRSFWWLLVSVALGAFAGLGLVQSQSALASPAFQGYGCPMVCDDAFYEHEGDSPTFVGAQGLMSSAVPQVRDFCGNSFQRVGLAHSRFTDITNEGFIEEGWIIAPCDHLGSTSRYLYASWSDTNCCYGYQSLGQLTDGDYSEHLYTVVRKNTTVFIIRFDEVEMGYRPTLDWKKGFTVACGAETTSTANAVGVSYCKNVSYKTSTVSWTFVPCHIDRVAAGYTLQTINPSEWWMYGNN